MFDLLYRTAHNAKTCELTSDIGAGTDINDDVKKSVMRPIKRDRVQYTQKILFQYPIPSVAEELFLVLKCYRGNVVRDAVTFMTPLGPPYKDEIMKNLKFVRCNGIPSGEKTYFLV